MERYNISKPKKYPDKNGEEKTQWNNIGTIVFFEKPDGTKNGIIEIPAIGLEANVFIQQPKENQGGGGQYPAQVGKPQYNPNRPIGQFGMSNTPPPEEEVRLEDIPF